MPAMSVTSTAATTVTGDGAPPRSLSKARKYFLLTVVSRAPLQRSSPQLASSGRGSPTGVRHSS